MHIKENIDRIEERQLKIINKFREHVNLPPIRPAERTCLKCSEKFQSEDITNRMCNYCKSRLD